MFKNFFFVLFSPTTSQGHFSQPDFSHLRFKLGPAPRLEAEGKKGGGGGEGEGREVFPSSHMIRKFRLFNIPEKKQTSITGRFPGETNIVFWVDRSDQDLDTFLPLNRRRRRGEGLQIGLLETCPWLVWLDCKKKFSYVTTAFSLQNG